jgi:hypothetical protein
MKESHTYRSPSVRVLSLALTAVYTLLLIGIIESTCGRESLSMVQSGANKSQSNIYSKVRNSGQDGLPIYTHNQQAQFFSYHLTIPHLYILKDLYTERFIATCPTDTPGEPPTG